MNSLFELNQYSTRTVLTVSDQRPATVIFDRPETVDPTDQVLDINSQTVNVAPGLEIEEIVNYSTADVRYEIFINESVAWVSGSSSIAWTTLPDHVSLTTNGTDTYTLSGLRDKTDWDAVKNFIWNLPAGYDIGSLWYLIVKVIWYDETTEQEKFRAWLVFDPDFYTVADFRMSSSMTAQVRKLFRPNIEMNSTVSIFCAEGIAKQGRATLNSMFTTNIDAVEPNIVAFSAALSSNSSQSVVYTRIKATTMAINSSATVSATATRILDLRPQIFSMSASIFPNLTDAPFEYVVQPLGGYSILVTGTNISVDWGDGQSEGPFNATTPTSVNNNYASVGTYTVKVFGNLTAIRLASNDGASRIQGILRFNNQLQSFSMEPVISGYEENEFTYVPTILPSNVTSLANAFRNCTVFNQDISMWDTSNVTNMDRMFQNAFDFDQDISSWCVENIPTKPTSFDSNTPTTWTTAEKPNWGAPC